MECSTKCAQLFHSMWWNAASRAPTLPVCSNCGLQAATSCQMFVSHYQRSMSDGRAFSVASPVIWNGSWYDTFLWQFPMWFKNYFSQHTSIHSVLKTVIVRCSLYKFISAPRAPMALGHTSRLRRSTTALDLLRLPIRAQARGLERHSLTPMTICRLWGCHMSNVVQIRSKLWPCMRNKEQTDIFGLCNLYKMIEWLTSTLFVEFFVLKSLVSATSSESFLVTSPGHP